MEDLKNKVAIITGSSAGIGEGTAVLFAKLGCYLTLTGRDQDRLKAVVQRCVQAGCPADKIVTVTGNIQEKEVQQELLDKTMTTFGRLDILVNNAGIAHFNMDTQKTTEEVYDETMDVNVKAAFFLSKLVAPELIKTKGNIVNVSSISSACPVPELVAYCMSKAALDMFTQCLALELAPKGVRVNSVNPGAVHTLIIRRGHENLNDQQYSELMEIYRQWHPLGFIGQPEDVANTIAFLASNMSRFITGTSVCIDGGYHFRVNSPPASAEGEK